MFGSFLAAAISSQPLARALAGAVPALKSFHDSGLLTIGVFAVVCLFLMTAAHHLTKSAPKRKRL